MKLSCSYRFRPKRPTCGTAYVQTVFGIGFETGDNVIAEDVELDYSRGGVMLFSGPSGSGKSSLLRAAVAEVGDVAWLGGPFEDRNDALIDTLGADVRRATYLLSMCGLGEAMLMLRAPGELSDGQRYRYDLARSIAGGAATVAADEWCAKLDRTAAKVISHNVRRLADRGRVGFLLATTHEDIIADLQPDVIIRCRGGGMVEVDQRERPRPFAGGAVRRKGARRAGKSVFYANSKSPPAPRRTGRTSLGGIIADTGSGPSGG